MAEIKINFSNCTRDAETCPVVRQIFEADEFEHAILPIDDKAQVRRGIFANVVTACVRSTCPGQDPKKAMEALERVRNRGRQANS